MIFDSVTIHKKDSARIDLLRHVVISLKDSVLLIECTAHDRLFVYEPKLLFLFEDKMIFSGNIKGASGTINAFEEIRLEFKL